MSATSVVSYGTFTTYIGLFLIISGAIAIFFSAYSIETDYQKIRKILLAIGVFIYGIGYILFR